MTELTPSPQRFAALRYRDFRLVWFGEMVSTTGSQMQTVAVDWHIFQLARDQVFTLTLFGSPINLDAGALALGTLGLVRVLPIIVFALIGGILADTRDRRKVMLWTRGTAAIFALVLAILTLSGQASPLAIYLLTAAGAAASAFDNPARQSLVPNLVDRKDLTNAVTLNTLMFQIATIAGPALAGVLIGVFASRGDSEQAANVGIGIIYLLNAVSFLFVVVFSNANSPLTIPSSLNHLSRVLMTICLTIILRTRCLTSNGGSASRFDECNPADASRMNAFCASNC
jgi:MFS family permease